MKLNLTTKTDEKKQLGVMIYESDYDSLQEIASNEGIKLTMLVRSILNDYLDQVKQNNITNNI